VRTKPQTCRKLEAGLEICDITCAKQRIDELDDTPRGGERRFRKCPGERRQVGLIAATVAVSVALETRGFGHCLIVKIWGLVIGGVLLAFPAKFPASATLFDPHEREKKRNTAIPATIRGRLAVGADRSPSSLAPSWQERGRLAGRSIRKTGIPEARTGRHHAPEFNVAHERCFAQALHHGVVVHYHQRGIASFLESHHSRASAD
jgi:hypothetical protein